MTIAHSCLRPRSLRDGFFLLASFLCLPAGAQSFEWARSIGSVDYDVAKDVHVDADGNIYSTGYAANDPISGCGTTNWFGGLDMYLTKYDASGNCVWSLIDGGPGGDEIGNGVATDANNNVYVTGSYSASGVFGTTGIVPVGMADAFVVKYDAAGAFQWVAHGGGSFDDEGRSIAADDAGNVFVCGHFKGNATFGTTTIGSVGNHDLFLAKLDATGNWLWVRSAGGLGGEDAFGVSTDASGNAYVTGHFSSSPAFFGTQALYAVGGADIFLAKYDATGNCLWVHSGGGATSDEGNAVATDALGNSYVTGWAIGDTVIFGADTLYTNGPVEDVVLAKYNTTGDLLWVVSAGGNDVDQGTGVALNEKDEPLITGNYSGTAAFGSTVLTSSGGQDVFVAGYDTSGSALWALSAGGTGYDLAGKVGADDVGNTYINGGYDTDATFGVNSVTAVASTDHYLAKISDLSTPVPIVPADAHISFAWDPATDLLTIHNGEYKGRIRYTVVDGTGRQVMRGTTELPNALRLGGMGSGTYLISVLAGDELAHTRIVVLH